MVESWLSTAPALVMSSRDSSGVPTSITITRVAPMARTAFTGTLSATRPSTSSRPSISTGAKPPGTAMLARIALARLPERSTTWRPVSMSVAMARKGIGSRSKSCTLATCSVSRLRCRSNFWPWMKASGKCRLPSR